MNENALSRIPFSVTDELMIASMARWMRFIGVIKLVTSLIMLFALLVGIIYVGAFLGADVSAAPRNDQPPITVTVDGETHQVPTEKVNRFLWENRLTFGALGAFGLLLAAVGMVLGMTLYHAADDFERVARSDVADQDFVSAGIAQLNTYFKLSILLACAAVLVAITAGIGLLAKFSVEM